MKKLFTLVAMAFMAVCVNAQDVIKFEKDQTAALVTQGKLTMNFGENSWKIGNFDAGTGNNLSPFIQVVDEKNKIYYFKDGSNPVDDNGIGYKPESKNLPIKGAYVTIKCAANGTCVAGLVINSGKAFYILDSKGEPISNFTIKNGDGNEVTLTDHKLAEKLYGTVEFDVVKDETYTILLSGSKIGVFGATFKESTPETAIESVKASIDDNAKSYNVGGRVASKGLLIKNGKKYVK